MSDQTNLGGRFVIPSAMLMGGVVLVLQLYQTVQTSDVRDAVRRGVEPVVELIGLVREEVRVNAQAITTERQERQASERRLETAATDRWYRQDMALWCSHAALVNDAFVCPNPYATGRPDVSVSSIPVWARTGSPWEATVRAARER